VNLKFRSGVSAQIQVSWLDPRKERRLTIVGSQKMVEFDDVHPVEKLRIYDKGVDRPPPFTEYAQFLSIRNGDIHIPQVPMVEPLEVECRHFVECVARASARSPTARLPCAWCASWKRPSDRWRAAAPRSTCRGVRRSPAGSGQATRHRDTLALGHCIGDAYPRFLRRKVPGIPGHKQTAIGPRRRPHDGVGKPKPRRLPDLDRL